MLRVVPSTGSSLPFRVAAGSLVAFGVAAAGWTGCGFEASGTGLDALDAGDSSVVDVALDVASDVDTSPLADGPSCSDGLKNGDETDFDCGGSRCAPCGAGRHCVTGLDCDTSLCTGGVCVGPGCANGAKDGSETDVDCGGPKCAKCTDGKACTVASDCTSSFCRTDTLVCATPSCGDGLKDGNESDVDCGGSCGRCVDGKKCAAATDCANGFCNPTTHACAMPTCTDGFKNSTESDVDCGGGCPKCADAKQCASGSDCFAAFCNPSSLKCATPSCADGFKNGSETDVDCGGSGACARCAAGKTCAANGDCAASWCASGSCKHATSCKALLAAVPGLPTGAYEIDPDGAAPNPSLSVYCDMTTDGGGWTFFAHTNQDYAAGNFFEKDLGTYRADRLDDNTTYSRGASILSFVAHSQMMISVDLVDPTAASAANRLIVYQYGAGATAFNKGPVPCMGLSTGFEYRAAPSGAFTTGGTSTNCDASHWYPTTSTGAFLVMVGSIASGAYWGGGVAGDSSWGHDAWWSVR